MYLRRLRTLMDLYLATDFIDELAMGYLEAIKQDAWRDSEKWGVGSVRGIEQGILQLRTQALPARRRQLFSENPEVPRQGFLSRIINLFTHSNSLDLW